MARPSDDREQFRYEYRSSWRRSLAAIGFPLLLTIGGALRLSTDDTPPAVVIPLVALFAVLIALLAWTLLRTATRTDAEHLTLQRPYPFHSKVFRWADVQDIEIEVNRQAGQRGQPTYVVAMYDAAGKRHLLPHLHDRNNLDLARTADTLRRIWLRQRGADWAAIPNVTVTIQRERTRPMPAINSAFIALGAAIVLGIVVFVVVIVSGGYQDENSVTATVFSPAVLIGGFPVAAFVITWVVVALRRRTSRPNQTKGSSRT